jgi:UDP-N-acetylmuramoyl-L-alanyl-D-glutamate--2,6-diaminopimelate ligase
MDGASRLARILADVPHRLLAGDPEIHVGHIRTDSRQIAPGDVFVCLPGYRSEGGEQRADRHAFIDAAVANGAGAVVVDRDIPVPPGVVVVRVDDCWLAAALLACARYGQPSRTMKMVGITGTSGKTSTSYFIDSVLRAAGLATARLGTIDYRFGDEILPAAQTTPEADELQRLLRRAVDAGMEGCVMEVSSHALELRRVGGVAFDAAVFTNLSQDHLNFHPDMHAYLRAKGRLFQELASGGKRAVAVVNSDDPHSAHIIRVNSGRLLTYGLGANASVRGHDVHTGLDGTRFAFTTPEGHGRIAIRHIGDYQVHNALAALATGVALGIPLDTVVAGIEATADVPGRFELVDAGQDFRVVVDYAHKPDALERLLRSARELQPNRVIVVFGCGGDRDRGKRPQMGRLAQELADIAVVTSDNPRSEDPAAIIDEILAGCRGEGSAGIVVEPDRARAIRVAIDMAQPSDLVLIAGKGHETCQITAGGRIDFDDREHARAALRGRRN